jgi:hypothetical protein
MQVGIKIWHRSLCRSLLKGIIGSRKAEVEGRKRSKTERMEQPARFAIPAL